MDTNRTKEVEAVPAKTKPEPKLVRTKSGLKAGGTPENWS